MIKIEPEIYNELRELGFTDDQINVYISNFDKK